MKSHGNPRSTNSGSRPRGDEMRHELKVYPDHFKALWCGDKTFEIRKNDRNFDERDEIVLQENTNGGTYGYTGREIDGFITYLTYFEQKPGYVVFSFKETGRREE